MSKKVRVHALLLVVLFLHRCVPASAETFPKLVLTTKNYALQSDPEFSCHEGTIHGYVTLAQPLKGKQVLESVWVNPHGVIENRHQTTIDYAEKGGQTAHIWLDFGHEGGLLSSVEDSGGANTVYDGAWTVKLKIEKTEIEQSFRVKC